MQSSAFVYSLDDHTSHLTHLTIRELLYHLLQAGDTTIAITLVQQAQTLDKQELIAILTLWETAFRQFGVGFHHLVAVVLESVVGSRIE